MLVWGKALLRDRVEAPAATALTAADSRGWGSAPAERAGAREGAWVGGQAGWADGMGKSDPPQTTWATSKRGKNRPGQARAARAVCRGLQVS